MKKFTIIIMLAIAGLSVNAQITFQKDYGNGGVGQNTGYSVLQIYDSSSQNNEYSYVFTGSWALENSMGVTNQYAYIIKVNSFGNLQWINIFKGGFFGSYGYSLIKTNDNGFAVAGVTGIESNCLNDQFFLWKTDSIGDSLWSKNYGDYYTDIAYSLKQTYDGGYILAGSADTAIGLRGHLMLIKTDANGDSLWGKTYGTTEYGEAHSVVQTKDSGYVVVGRLIQPINLVDDVYLFKTNSHGDTLWTRRFGGAGDDQGYSLQKTTDNGFIIVGCTMSYGAGGYDAYLIKTDSNGNFQWQKTFGGLDDDYGNWVNLTSDGGYIIVGSTQSFSVGGGFDVYLIKTDQNGNQQWYRTFGGVNDDYGYSVQQTYDGGYIIVGMRGNYIYLIKTDANGNATNIQEKNLEDYLFEVFPNPATTSITIQTPAIADINILNLEGQLIKQQITNQTTTNIDVSALAKGMYFVKVKTENGVAVKKFIKE